MKNSHEPIRIIFAKNLKKHRENLRYSQEKLAEKAELSVQTIKDIEGGRRWVSDDSLSKLAKALNSPEFMLFLPDKYEKDKKYKKQSLKSLTSLKTRIKKYMDEQFEDAMNSGDFS
ncbi:MAG: helix-turn-helix domain-containing protein [Treponema sp.]|nr:helix-turn-helix domain-containing protein [Treponema sp.]